MSQRWGTWYFFVLKYILILASEVLVLVLVLGCDVLVPIKNFLTAKVPASSSPVKRMFSQAGIISPHRARMSDKLFLQLILLKYNSGKLT